MNEPKKDLEKWMHERLRQLPELQAPESLAANVLATIRARENQAWFAQPWMAWPRAARIISATFFLGVLGAVAFYAQPVFSYIKSFWQNLENPLTSLEPIWQMLTALANALVLVGQSNQTWLMFAGGVFLFLYLVCIGMGTMFVRFAFNRHNL